MVKGVIFDMDGTMFDTERLLTVAWDKAAKKMGVVISPELMEACRGKSPEAIGKLLKAEFGEDFDYDRICLFKNNIYHEMIKENGVPVKNGLKVRISERTKDSGGSCNFYRQGKRGNGFKDGRGV